MYNPVSTYRIQFHKAFTFAHFEQLIPYFEKLGVKTIYASPVFTSVAGSTHGYDGLDPLSINPEIGTLSQLRRISKKLRTKNIGWIQDIVPNHMAFHPDNAWLMDILEKGPGSRYVSYFDTCLADNRLFGNKPLMVPFLGDDLETVIDRDELHIVQTGNKYAFNYADSYWPLRPGSYPRDKITEEVNKDKAALKKIAQNQYYRLCSWKETDNLINFRRFFTVNGLICLNMQHEDVFNHFHQLIGKLVNEGIFQGLRIDHVDGLFEPSAYLARLRKLVGDEVYVIVEKILETGEQMPPWPVQGNTGYDFLAIVNNLLTNRAAKKQFTDFYRLLTGGNAPIERQIREKKANILKQQMGGELDNLTRYFISENNIASNLLKHALAEFLIRCPVYRYYGNSMPLNAEEQKAVGSILDSIAADLPELKAAVRLLKNAWLTDDVNATPFFQRCMQFTGPLMAKGVEDTLMYTYNRFIAHNEVGDAPAAFGISVDEFHRQMEQRQFNWPLSMNGTSTHDTKRGEDARARLNVLTDIPGRWLALVEEWRKLNAALAKAGAPDPNDEYFIYETLVATYPMPGEPEDDYPQRLEQYLEKTLREAKVHSGWAAPNDAYENAVKRFALSILDKTSDFWKTFEPFHRQVCEYGVINSVSQVLLKLTAPGVPDIYQGCERWDLSLVDPDNRRPVDYGVRSSSFERSANVKELWAGKFSGEIKQWLLHRLLTARNNDPDLFANGQYIALQTSGNYRENVIAYARKLQNCWYLVIAPLGPAAIKLCDRNFDWKDTAVILPENLAGEFENVLTGKTGKLSPDLKLTGIFSDLPVALLKVAAPVNERSAGILMHITSLPSDFAIGDFGPRARSFADKLRAAGQKYWQLLPLNPVSADSQYSPYSSWSAMGGNTLLISPELLVEDGLLTGDVLKGYRRPSTDCVDFKAAAKIKAELLQLAYNSFKTGKSPKLRFDFEKFCTAEQVWLDDFAIYSLLKENNGRKPWYEWPRRYKLRDEQALKDFALKQQEKLDEIRWQQFIFRRQWEQLKQYCNRRDILLLGDLPFYVSYDSVDVWANPAIFSLDRNGRMLFVAGVPPDYFNAKGQLWGMPVFRWNELKTNNYSWWVERMRLNMVLFDVIRLDHFRAFSAYWSVPAGDDTAINGKWEPGPGVELFNVLKHELGKLPFVAEDLGDIDESVYKLRDTFNLPGMKVLQFAFGEDMAVSPHIPHNYTQNHFVYTGTHDNNTTTGWYGDEADDLVRNNINSYMGYRIKQSDVAKRFIKMAMSSVAGVAIVPVQDVYALDTAARMNMPASATGNWQWRITQAQLKRFPEKKIRKWSTRYNRVT